MTEGLFKITIKTYVVSIGLIGLAIFVLFLASGHSANGHDLEQLKAFFSGITFLTASFVLLAFGQAKNHSERKERYTPSLIFLIASFIALVYVVSEMYQVKYGDEKPYFIFTVILVGLISNLLLIYFLLARKDILLSE